MATQVALFIQLPTYWVDTLGNIPPKGGNILPKDPSTQVRYPLTPYTQTHHLSTHP